MYFQATKLLIFNTILPEVTKLESFVFESHQNADGALPFIFHYDVLSENAADCSVPEGVPLLRYGKRCIYNWHENIELLYIVKGEGTLFSDGRRFSFREGDTVAVNSLELHFTEALNELSYFVIIPDRGFLKVNSVDTSALSLKHVITSEESGALFWRIAKLYASDCPLREAKLKAALLELVILLADSFRSDEAALPQSKSLARMKIIISYINAHLEEHISADEVARAASLSKYHFLREFKKLTGMTLVSFINNLRCEKARSLLSSGELSVSEVCSACGFDNASYFTRVFRENAGMTPSDYRAMCRR